MINLSQIAWGRVLVAFLVSFGATYAGAEAQALSALNPNASLTLAALGHVLVAPVATAIYAGAATAVGVIVRGDKPAPDAAPDAPAAPAAPAAEVAK